ncbi:MAG: molybdopterin adenylyltransferase, partial [Alphaproteobacteria bacterium]|nr:molybdopterin adenylyltransferase [Alphaproteobacteria bacterium]
MPDIKIGILTASDRASAGIYEDISGPAIVDTLNDYLSSEWRAVRRVIPDDRAVVEKALIELADEEDCCLIVTTGGTGPAPRDLVPEATEAVCDKMMPGFGELMRQVSLQ